MIRNPIREAKAKHKGSQMCCAELEKENEELKALAERYKILAESTENLLEKIKPFVNEYLNVDF